MVAIGDCVFSHRLWCSIVCFVEHFALVLRLIVIIIYLSLVIGDEHNVGMDVNKEGAGKTPEKGGTGTWRLTLLISVHSL